MKVNIKVLGGLPITVEASFTRGSPYDIGPRELDIDDWKIVAIAGRHQKHEPAWLRQRLEASPAELGRMNTAIWTTYYREQELHAQDAFYD